MYIVNFVFWIHLCFKSMHEKEKRERKKRERGREREIDRREIESSFRNMAEA